MNQAENSKKIPECTESSIIDPQRSNSAPSEQDIERVNDRNSAPITNNNRNRLSKSSSNPSLPQTQFCGLNLFKPAKKQEVQPKILDYRIVQILGNDHCFYNAVGQHVNLNATQLREQIANHISSNQNIYADLMDKNTSFDDYLAGIRKDAWGGDLEMQAVERIFERKIIVVHEKTSEVVVNGAIPNLVDGDTPNDEKRYNGPPIYLLYSDSHYDALIKEEPQHLSFMPLSEGP